MSQMSGVPAGGRVGGNRFSSSGRAALLLTLAVVVGVVALQQIDDVPQALPGSAANQASAVADPTPAPVEQSAPPVRAPSEVKVLVANGVGVSGAAARVASRIQPAGYQMLTPGNTVQNTTTSMVQYAPGYEAEARVLAESMNLSSQAAVPMSTPAPVKELQDANLIVIIGTELANQTQQTSTATNATQQGTTGQQGTTAGANAGQAVIPNAAQSGSVTSTTAAGTATAVNGPLTPSN